MEESENHVVAEKGQESENDDINVNHKLLINQCHLNEHDQRDKSVAIKQAIK